MTEDDVADLLARSRGSGSWTALARRIGISRQALSHVINGRRRAGKAILRYLRIRVARKDIVYVYERIR